jgi:hypothetical protein
VSERATALADATDALQRASGDLDADELGELQRLLAAAVALYASRLQAGATAGPFPAAAPPTATDVCLTVTAMLDAVSVEVFELAMFKSWSATPGGDAQRSD